MEGRPQITSRRSEVESDVPGLADREQGWLHFPEFPDLCCGSTSGLPAPCYQTAGAGPTSMNCFQSYHLVLHLQHPLPRRFWRDKSRTLRTEQTLRGYYIAFPGSRRSIATDLHDRQDS